MRNLEDEGGGLFMADKCSKCGNIIPDGAGFCASCGAPKAGGQPIQQYQQPMPSTGGGLNDMVKMLFSKKLIALGILIGILLIFISIFIWTFAYPDADTKDADDYGILKIPAIMSHLGFFIISAVLLCGGLLNTSFDKYIRLGMILAGAWILAATLSISDLNPNYYLPWPY